MITIHKNKHIGNGEKRCAGECGKIKPYSEFYVRSGYGTPENPALLDGHFNSECKECLKQRSVGQKRLPPWESRVQSEQLAIDYLMAHRIWAQTGKMTSAPDVDVCAWSCVWIEVKYARLEIETGGRSNRFNFVTTPAQDKRGFLSHIVMLICDYGDDIITYHLFHADAPYFYKVDGTVKTGFVFTPNHLRRNGAGNPGYNPITQEVMDEAMDNIDLIEQWRCWIADDLGNGDRPVYGKPFAR